MSNENPERKESQPSDKNEPQPDASARTMLMPAPEFSNAYRGVPVKPDEELFVEQNRLHDPGALTQMMAAPTAIMTTPGFVSPLAAPPVPPEQKQTEDAASESDLVPLIPVANSAPTVEPSTHETSGRLRAPDAAPAEIDSTERATEPVIPLEPLHVAAEQPTPSIETEPTLPLIAPDETSIRTDAPVIAPPEVPASQNLVVNEPVVNGSAAPSQERIPTIIKSVDVVRPQAPLAPPPDSPFGGVSDTSPPSSVGISPGYSQSMRAPMPSGANWRRMLDQVPTAPPKPVLVAKGLEKWFGQRHVVRGVEIEVGAGEIVGLLGRNGAGKTTTFRMIMGLLHPDGGSVTYENRDVTRLPMYQRANRGIGYLAQTPSIFQKLTVEENLMAVLELQEPNKKARIERMEKQINDLGLVKVRKSQAMVLSGGERRRLEIARAMSLRPRVVLFDEPFAGIDPITITEIQGFIRELKNQGVGVLLTDHQVRETLMITDRTYIMDEGKIWIHGHPREIVENEEARSRYLGHEFRLDF